jgi:hypothetical protein
MSTPSLHFLAAHQLFSAAVAAFQNTPEAERTSLSEKDVASAFEAATQALDRKDKNALVKYVEQLLSLPGKVADERSNRRLNEYRLDSALLAKSEAMRRDGILISTAELLKRTGMREETLSAMLKQHRIFKLPRIYRIDFDGDPDYFPSFYADKNINLDRLWKVWAAMRALDGLRKFRFLITPEPSMENRMPIEVIANSPDELETVLEKARAFRKHVA